MEPLQKIEEGKEGEAVGVETGEGRAVRREKRKRKKIGKKSILPRSCPKGSFVFAEHR